MASLYRIQTRTRSSLDRIPQNLKTASRPRELQSKLARQLDALSVPRSANHPAINQGEIFVNQDILTTDGAGRRQTNSQADGATPTIAGERKRSIPTSRSPLLTR